MTKPRIPKTPKTTAVPNLGPIEIVPTALLKTYARNARTHNERQVALIAQSIETFGFNNPIIAEEDGTIIAGHGRWEAAKGSVRPNAPIVRGVQLGRSPLMAFQRKCHEWECVV